MGATPYSKPHQKCIDFLEMRSCIIINIYKQMFFFVCMYLDTNLF